MLGRPILRCPRSAVSSTWTTGSSSAIRLTELSETPAKRATSIFAWPAFSKTSISCRFNIPNILLPPLRSTDNNKAEHREISNLSGYRRKAQNFWNVRGQNFRNRHVELCISKVGVASSKHQG